MASDEAMYETYICFLCCDLYFIIATTKITANTSSIDSNPMDANGIATRKTFRRGSLYKKGVPVLQFLVAACLAL